VKAARILVMLLMGLTLWALDWEVTWKLNVGKSKYACGIAPKSATIKYQKTADGIKVTSHRLDAEGKATSFEYFAKDDGQDYPVTGSDLYDTVSLTKIKYRHTGTHRQTILKKSGKVVTTSYQHVYRWGMSLSINCTNKKGETEYGIEEYDRIF
jgi:hypothetical protein